MPNQNEALKYSAGCGCWLLKLNKVRGKAEAEKSDDGYPEYC